MLSLWMMCDVVLDMRSFVGFYKQMQNETKNDTELLKNDTVDKEEGEPISVGYFVACLVFLFLPSLFFMIMELDALFKQALFDSWSSSCSQLLAIPLLILHSVVMMITLPLQATILSGSNLIFGDDNMVEKKMDDFKLLNSMRIIDHLKLFEILGESLPQLIISIVFIANNGGVETHPWNTTSAVFSAGSVMIGIITYGNLWFQTFCGDKKDKKVAVESKSTE